MRFDDVDDQERDLLVVLVIELVEGGNLPPEGRSSVAAEDEDDGSFGGECGKLDALALVELQQGEVGGCVARAEFTGAGVGPERFKWQAQEDDGGGGTTASAMRSHQKGLASPFFT